MLLEIDYCFSAYILETFFQGSNTALRKINVSIVVKNVRMTNKNAVSIYLLRVTIEHS